MKLLDAIDIRKVGFTKSDQTRLNGAQSAEVRDKQLKPGDIAYHKDQKIYLKLEKYVVPSTLTNGDAA